MSLLVMVYDADPDRRRRTIDRINREPLPNASELTRQEWSNGHWHAVAHYALSTPIQHHRHDKTLLVMMGRLLDRDLTLLTPGDAIVQPIGGFGASISACATTDHFSAQTDFMGIFPIYYASGKDWMMVTSAASIIKCHPSYTPEWNVEGLTSVLLTMHIVTGQTVWKGIRRLKAGHRLEWNPAHGFSEVCEYRITAPKPATTDMTDAIADRLERVMTAWRDPHAPIALLLSGGLDSRLLAGLLRRQTDREITAHTYGIDTDLEIQCAKRVAERLRLKHNYWEFTHRDYLESLKWTAKLELASNGLSTGIQFAAINRIAPGSQLVNGFSLDCFMQSPHYFKNKLSSDPTPDGIIDFYGRWGIPAETVSRLMPGEQTNQALRGIRQYQRDFFHAYASTRVAQAGLFYENLFRQRHHIAGMAWRISFGAWPVMPAYDAPLIELMLSVSDDLRLNRKIERDIVRRLFPDIARVPLDGNDASPMPLIPNRWWHKMSDAFRGWQPARVPPVTGKQQLRYYRTLDINAPTWRSVREEIEPLREYLNDMFDPATLEELFPKPDVQISMQRPIPESSSRKVIMGIAIIASEMKKSVA